MDLKKLVTASAGAALGIWAAQMWVLKASAADDGVVMVEEGFGLDDVVLGLMAGGGALLAMELV